MTHQRGRFGIASWTFAGAVALAMPGLAAIDDPCILSVSEAREVGGADTVQAGSDRETCTYRSSSSEPRLSIELVAPATPEGQERLRRLEDGAQFASRKQGKATTWTAKDELIGWVLEGDTFVEVRVEGRKPDRKVKRSLELALFKITEKLH
jgi:hypothetical protein